MRGEYVSKGEETVVGVLPVSDFVEVRITKIMDGDSLSSVDIRQWYCTSKDPVKKPNQKGVRLSAENVELLHSVLGDVLGNCT